MEEQKAEFFTVIKFRGNKVDGHCSHVALNSGIISLHLAKTMDTQPSSSLQANPPHEHDGLHHSLTQRLTLMCIYYYPLGMTTNTH